MKSSSKRILLNTSATYLRACASVALALFSSRWILQELGASDYGLYTVVGAIVVFLTFFNSVMATSAARHFAFAIGKGNLDETIRWFNASLCVHLVLPASLIAAGWPIAEYLIRNILTIPQERLSVCLIIFRLSLASAFFNMTAIPFVAMFKAKQCMVELALWIFMQSVFVFLLAFGLRFVTTDRLIFFAVCMMSIHTLMHIIKITRALHRFPECRIRTKFFFDPVKSKELLGFAVWSMIGQAGGNLRGRGSSLLLNVYFGPLVNAAFGIAEQVSVQMNSLSAAFMGAISPEMTRREGSGHRDSMILMALRACKFGTLLLFVFSIPFLLETDYVLHLWLVEPPRHSAMLTQLIILTAFANKISAGYTYAIMAQGRIAMYQATLGSLLLLTVPLAWLFLAFGQPPEAVGIAFIIMQSLCSFGRVLWGKRLLGIPIMRWVAEIVTPCVLTAASMLLGGRLVSSFLPASFARLMLVSSVTSLILVIVCWKLVLTADEMRGIGSIIKQFRAKLPARRLS